MGRVARRQFLTAAGAMLAAPLALSRTPHRIGLLPDHIGVYLDWFLEGMRRHGWREGRTAKALGLEVPSRLLLQADRVIE